MIDQAKALGALSTALSQSEPCLLQIEEAWEKALVQATGAKYERRLINLAIAPDLSNRAAMLQDVQSILDGFGAEPSEGLQQAAFSGEETDAHFTPIAGSLSLDGGARANLPCRSGRPRRMRSL